jgi:hypothetical protein
VFLPCGAEFGETAAPRFAVGVGICPGKGYGRCFDEVFFGVKFTNEVAF